MSTSENTNFIVKLVQKLNKNPIFKFLSSIRMAVPLMLFLAVIVAIGTIYESKYNTQIAQIVVYRSNWFLALLILFWINIFSAAVSRIPFKKHHTGFVITHIGLLTLLYGAALTFIFGIDGSLRIVEGQSNRVVLLQDLVIKFADRKSGRIETFPIKRTLKEQSGSDMGLEEFTSKTGIAIDRVLPFVSASQGYVESAETGSGTAIEFKLQSQFFNVTQTLHSKNQPELQMGPAKLRIISSAFKAKPSKETQQKPAKIPTAKATSGISKLIIKNENSIIKEIKISELKKSPITVNGVSISYTKEYNGAQVSGGKLVDVGAPGSNPAIELSLTKGAQTIREVNFEKFPAFTLNQNGTFGLKFEYHSAGGVVTTENTSENKTEDSNNHLNNESPSMTSGHTQNFDRSANTIEFHLLPNDTSKVQIELYKENKLLAKEIKQIGEELTTPWMGMKITPLKIIPNASTSTDIVPVDLVPKMPSPPSAIQIRSLRDPSGQKVWLVEGEAQSLSNGSDTIEIYYGVDTIDLPFELQLEKFSKVDYPGTSTPMSYESRVKINGTSAPIDIKMNEPLHHEGFVLYQASYEMEPGQPPATILSVNRDPGRTIKYIGAIILCAGIVIFTLMRSRVYRNWNERKST